MLYQLSGIFTRYTGNFAVILVGGVSFRVYMPETTKTELPALNSPISVYCHLHVREDALDVYGFLTEEELFLFESLISVSGVGPKSALNIMGVSKASQLIAAINEGRTELLVKASGIGRKTAERVILDLKGKLSFGDSAKTISGMEADLDLEQTLVDLGFSKAQAKQAISKIDPKIKHFNERLKEALKQGK